MPKRLPLMKTNKKKQDKTHNVVSLVNDNENQDLYKVNANHFRFGFQILQLFCLSSNCFSFFFSIIKSKAVCSLYIHTYNDDEYG